LDDLGPELRPKGFQLNGVFEAWPVGVAYRSSRVEDNNPRFGTTHFGLDWGEIAFDERVFAYREVGSRCQFRLLSQSRADLDSFFKATYSGLCFLFGCRVRIRGWQRRINEKMENVLFGGRQVAVRRVYPPLDNFLWHMKGTTGFEETLALASRFFLTEKGQKVRASLSLLWDAADLPIQSRLLIAATTLEGLVREVAQHEEQSFAYMPQVTECLRKAGAEVVIIKRVEGLLTSMRGLHVPTELRRWVEEQCYAARDDEVTAFKRRRHPLVHGGMLDDPTDPEAKQDLALITNLINKVILNQMGYRGPYADYAGPRDYSSRCPVIM
jgi:hypothetical protein